MNPFDGDLSEDRRDAELAVRSASGDRDALDQLLSRHQRWVYALALRMARDPDIAADVAQEALIRMVTRIAQFEGRSSFRTWAYRIVVRCLLDSKRSRSEERFPDARAFGDALDELPLEELVLDPALEPERALIVEETHIGCMLGMLLCLDREQRMVYILGDIFETTSELGAELLEISPEAFRKRLERARADLAHFTLDRCGLVDEKNPCRCPKKTAALIRRGWVDPRNLRFGGPGVQAIREAAPSLSKRLRVLRDEVHAELYRGHPFHVGPDFAGALRSMFGD